MTTTAYAVTGMSCAHCESAIREEVAKIEGVEVVSVRSAEGSLVVSTAGEAPDAAVIAAVDEAGYAAARV